MPKACEKCGKKLSFFTRKTLCKECLKASDVKASDVKAINIIERITLRDKDRIKRLKYGEVEYVKEKDTFAHELGDSKESSTIEPLAAELKDEEKGVQLEAAGTPDKVSKNLQKATQNSRSSVRKTKKSAKRKTAKRSGRQKGK